jgi:hypothetical protein
MCGACWNCLSFSERNPWLCPLASPYRSHDLKWYFCERYDAAEDSQLRAGSRHAIDSASRFILPYRESTLAVDGLHPFRTVASHSGQDDSQSKLSEGSGNGFHRDVDGWNVEMMGLRVEADFDS